MRYATPCPRCSQSMSVIPFVDEFIGTCLTCGNFATMTELPAGSRAIIEKESDPPAVKEARRLIDDTLQILAVR